MKDILIVIDMQNDFITGSLGTKAAESILPRVVNKISDFRGPVFYTRDTHTSEYHNTAEGEKLPIVHCVKGTWGWNLEPEIEKLKNAGDSLVFDKITFGSKELAAYLVQNLRDFGGIRSITLCGLCTDICVISNALLIKAFLPEVPLIVDSACCAGVSPESHLNALEAMHMCQIDIV